MYIETFQNISSLSENHFLTNKKLTIILKPQLCFFPTFFIYIQFLHQYLCFLVLPNVVFCFCPKLFSNHYLTLFHFKFCLFTMFNKQQMLLFNVLNSQGKYLFTAIMLVLICLAQKFICLQQVSGKPHEMLIFKQIWYEVGTSAFELECDHLSQARRSRDVKKIQEVKVIDEMRSSKMYGCKQIATVR